MSPKALNQGFILVESVGKRVEEGYGKKGVCV